MSITGLQATSLADRPELALPAAQLLAGHWPATGARCRVQQMRAALRAAEKSSSGLPAHLLLLDPSGAVVAHCRLQRAGESVGEHGGFSAALTSVVVRPSRRGGGVGRALLRLAEGFAAARGFCYIYLWTPDAAGFYEACGYSRCASVTLHRPALAGLSPEAVGKLEALMAGKAGRAAAGTGGRAGDAAEQESGAGSGQSGSGAPPESVATQGCVWLRKRLLERSAGRAVWGAAELRGALGRALQSAGHVRVGGAGGEAQRVAEVCGVGAVAGGAGEEEEPEGAAPAPGAAREVFTAEAGAVGGVFTVEGVTWDVFTASSATWERQVGPCCELCALRMARSALRPACEAGGRGEGKQLELRSGGEEGGSGGKEELELPSGGKRAGMRFGRGSMGTVVGRRPGRRGGPGVQRRRAARGGLRDTREVKAEPRRPLRSISRRRRRALGCPPPTVLPRQAACGRRRRALDCLPPTVLSRQAVLGCYWGCCRRRSRARHIGCSLEMCRKDAAACRGRGGGAWGPGPGGLGELGRRVERLRGKWWRRRGRRGRRREAIKQWRERRRCRELLCTAHRLELESRAGGQAWHRPIQKRACWRRRSRAASLATARSSTF